MLSTTKRKLLTVGLCLILAFALCFGALALTRQQNAGAEDDYGAITVHKHDGGMLGITIEGVESAGPAMPGQDDFFNSMNQADSNKQFAPFFANFYLNGMPVFNWYHAPTMSAPNGNYLLGGEELTLNSRGECIISYADYAIAMVDEAVKGNHDQQRISVVRA